MSRATVGASLLAALCFVGVTSVTGTAGAVYQCGDQTDDCQCGADDPYPCCDNGGNCTWWAWEAACCNWAVALPGWGNANQWAGNANLNPSYDVLSNPVVGSIACRVSGTYGHVAWVTAVSGSTVTVTEENCCTGCNYGLRTYSYAASYFDGGYIVRAGQCDCSAGQTQSDACGNCGTRERSCGGDCKWGGWSACSGEGECAKGDTEEQACGDCGSHARTCDDGCHWGDFGACSGPDPSGGTEACDTGLQGVCAAGTRRCVDGALQCEQSRQTSAEVCDGEDNDCDGQVDEGGICGDDMPRLDSGTGGTGGTSGIWPEAGAPDGGVDAAGAWGSNADEASGCACRSAGPRRGSFAAALTALVALALVLRPRSSYRDRVGAPSVGEGAAGSLGTSRCGPRTG